MGTISVWGHQRRCALYDWHWCPMPAQIAHGLEGQANLVLLWVNLCSARVRLCWILWYVPHFQSCSPWPNANGKAIVWWVKLCHTWDMRMSVSFHCDCSIGTTYWHTTLSSAWATPADAKDTEVFELSLLTCRHRLLRLGGSMLPRWSVYIASQGLEPLSRSANCCPVPVRGCYHTAKPVRPSLYNDHISTYMHKMYPLLSKYTALNRDIELSLTVRLERRPPVSTETALLAPRRACLTPESCEIFYTFIHLVYFQSDW